MITASDAWTLKNESRQQDTIYVLYLVDWGVYLSTDTVDGLSTQVLIAARPALPQGALAPLAASASVGSMTFQIRDKAKAFTALRRAHGSIEDVEVTVWEGYQGLPWADYLTVLRGKAADLKLSPDRLTWSFDVKDPWDQADWVVFKEADIAAEPYSGGDKSFDGGSLILQDSDGDSVYDTVVLRGYPSTLMLKMLLSDGSGSGGYNVWPSWAGVGLTEDDIDIDWCEAEGEKIPQELEFALTGPENVRDFIQEQVCKAFGGYPIPDGTGRIRIRYPSRPVSTEALQAITDSDILKSGRPVWSDPQDLLITHIIYEMDHDGSNFGTRLERASPQWLAGQYKSRREHKISSRGLQTALGGLSVADAIMDQLFARYGDPPVRVRFSTHYRCRTAQPGDALTLQTTEYPDVDGLGTDGTRIVEALSVRGSINKCDFEVLDLTAALSNGARAAIIAPDGQADYDSATDTEKAYAYIGDAAPGTVGAAGDAPYYFP